MEINYRTRVTDEAASMTDPGDDESPRQVRTLFLSDVHLGMKGCQAEKLLDFLRCYDAKTIYLVGDIVDGWQLRSSWYWPQTHNDVVQKLLRKARKGTQLFYIPGNHDEFLRDYYGTHFGGIEVVEERIHVAADGRCYLVIHGDLFDVVIRHAKWLALLGDKAYDAAIWLNTHFNAIRRAFGFTYWSLSQWAKLKVKNAVNFIGEFERTLAAEARRRGLDGVICGHIHHAVIRAQSDFRYMNCGDWVESCTALVEDFDGAFEIITWTTRAPWPADVEEESVPASSPLATILGRRRTAASLIEPAAPSNLSAPAPERRRQA
jgi:UDP-2,3-diacylglucosamine pyrophosphatase LpxH